MRNKIILIDLCKGSLIVDTVQKELDYLKVLRDAVDNHLKDVSPVKVVAITAGATYSLALLHNFITKDPEHSILDNTII